MVPVRQAWNDDAFEVAEDLVEGLAVLGRCVRERVANVARADARQYRITFGVFEIVGDPVGNTMGRRTEIARIVYRFST